MLRALLAFALPIIAAACGTELPTSAASSSSAPSLAAGPSAPIASARQSGCYSVSGTISEVGVFPNFSGTITGDLVGTSQTTLSFDTRSTGAAIHNPGERTLAITGGTVPELIGTNVHEVFEGVSIFTAPPLVRINERTRVVAGAERGNITTHGTLDLTVFPWTIELVYHGVVCP